MRTQAGHTPPLKISSSSNKLYRKIKRILQTFPRDDLAEKNKHGHLQRFVQYDYTIFPKEIQRYLSNIIFRNNTTPLTVALKYGSVSAVCKLVRLGANLANNEIPLAFIFENMWRYKERESALSIIKVLLAAGLRVPEAVKINTLTLDFEADEIQLPPAKAAEYIGEYSISCALRNVNYSRRSGSNISEDNLIGDPPIYSLSRIQYFY